MSASEIVKEPLNNPSFRRMPESMLLKPLDPGIRRDDGKRINQSDQGQTTITPLIVL